MNDTRYQVCPACRGRVAYTLVLRRTIDGPSRLEARIDSDEDGHEIQTFDVLGQREPNVIVTNCPGFAVTGHDV